MSTPPGVYLVYGEDSYTMHQFITNFEAKLGDSTTIALNTTRLDGKIATLHELTAAVRAIPFLAARRIVTLQNPIAMAPTPSKRKELLDSFEHIPPAIALMLVVEQNLEHRDPGKHHWLLKWAQKQGKKVFVRPCHRLQGPAMQAWILKQAKTLGGSFSRSAARCLSDLVGDDTGTAIQEIEKLLAFVQYSRPVEDDDVMQLFPSQGVMSDFELVNAIRDRDSQRALSALKQTLETKNAVMLLGSVVSQFRMLLLARGILDQGGRSTEVMRILPSAIGVKPYPAKLAAKSARKFSDRDLLAIYHKLLDLDEAVKTGRMEGETALYVFISATTMA